MSIVDFERHEPLWGMPIFPVSLMTSGMSFVSSILEEINSSN